MLDFLNGARFLLTKGIFMQKTSSHYAVLLSELAENSGLNTAELIKNIGHFESDQQWVDNGFVASMVKSLWNETGDDLLGLAPDPMRQGSWAVACNHMLISETLGELYRLGARILSYLPPASMGISCAVNGSDFDVHINCYEGELDPNRFLTEFVCVTWHRFPCWVIDQYIPLKQAYFSYPAPPHSWFYEELFQCPILFDQPHTGFSFDKKYLTNAVCRNRSELELWLNDSPADMLYLPGRDATIGSYVRKQLDKQLRGNRRFPAFELICEELNMSSQVVRRRLSEEGENYQHLKDSVRSELIKELLINTELPLADITERAGFQEVASLSRAFKRWTSFTPAEFRKNYSISIAND